MSDHNWTEENLVAYIAGGLEAKERDLVEQHLAECADCTRVLEECRALDGRLMQAFARVQPTAALEDRTIQKLRERNTRRRGRIILIFKAAMATAAVILLAVFGAGVSALLLEDRLPAPAEARNNLKLPLVALFDDSESKGSEDGTYFGVNRVHSGDGTGFVSGLTPRGTFTPSDKEPLKDADTIAKELSDGMKIAMLNGTTHHGLNWDRLTEPGKGKQLGQQFGYSTNGQTLYSPPATPPSQIPPPKEGGESSAGNQGLDEKKPIGSPSTSGGFGGEWGLPAGPGTSPSGGSGGLIVNGTRGFSGEGKDKNSLLGTDKGPFGYYVNPLTFAPSPPGKPGDGKETVQAGDKSGARRLEELGKLGAEQQTAKNDKAKIDLDKYIRDNTPNYTDQQSKDQKQPQAGQPAGRKIIRTGEIDFEVNSFDSSVAAIQQLVAGTKDGFIATINSDKLPNGKVKGSVVVRVPPEQLDGLVLGLRRELGKDGELIGQRIGSQDITKQYTDLESRLKAARTMEERLLKVIKEGKGEVKDLVLAEKELGVWTTKIEELEGELRYYASLVALSTLTINLTEKSITTAAKLIESERVNTGIEVDDVEKAMREVLKAVEEAKGRIIRSEMKQHSAGQFNAILHFEVAPDKAGPIRDRLKQIGHIARLEIDRVQTTEQGTKAPENGKVQRGDTQFVVSIYNLVAIAPRETVVLTIAAEDVPTVFQKLREEVSEAKGRMVNAQLNEQDRQNITATLQFDVHRDVEAKIRAALDQAGEVLTRSVTRRPEADGVTDAKVQFQLQIMQASNLLPRETVTLTVAAEDVPAAFQKLRDAVVKAKGRINDAKLNEQDRQNISANLDFIIRRDNEADVRAKLGEVGEVLTRNVVRVPESTNVTDARVAFKLTLTPATNIAPRKTIEIGIVVENIDTALSVAATQVREAGGRMVVEPKVVRSENGQVVAQVVYDVPLAGSDSTVERLKTIGDFRSKNVTPNPQAHEGRLAVARIVLVVSTTRLVPEDESFLTQIRKGLSISLRGLSISASWLIVAVLFVLPWVVILYFLVWVVRRLWRGRQTA